MVLVGYLTALRIFSPSKLNVLPNDNNDNYRESVLKIFLSFSIIVILFMLTVFPAVVIAYSCNKRLDKQVLHILFAFFLSDIYLCNYVFKKFIFKKNVEC